MKDKTNCSGCGACAYVCPANAITMKPDVMGFLYPEVDESICIHCNRCHKVCPNGPQEILPPYPQYLVGRCKEEKELMRSQSGGAFYAISQHAIQRGFVIYGAAFDEQFHVVHRRATTEEERDRFRGTKYVQSNVTTIYKDLFDDLKNGKTVLFSGTPCQVAGIKSAAGKKLSQNLYLVDLVCHAAPAPGIWHDNLEQIKRNYKADIIEANIRDKQFRTTQYWETYRLSNGKKLKRQTSNYFFTKHLSVRESCFHCPFSSLNRVGDITIGDFHAVSLFGEKYADFKGLSSVIVNTPKGAEFLDALHEIMNLEEISRDMMLQPQLQAPIAINPLRENFVRDYTEKGFDYVARKYGDQGIRYKCIWVRNKFHGLYKRIKRIFSR